MATVRVTSTHRFQKPLLATPLATPLSAGLLLVPTLVIADASCCHVRIANLSKTDIIVPARSPLAALQAVKDVQSKYSVSFTTTVSELIAPEA